jgi:hypothetical protein
MTDHPAAFAALVDAQRHLDALIDKRTSRDIASDILQARMEALQPRAGEWLDPANPTVHSADGLTLLDRQSMAALVGVYFELADLRADRAEIEREIIKARRALSRKERSLG